MGDNSTSAPSAMLKVDPARATVLAANLEAVRNRMTVASAAAAPLGGGAGRPAAVRLVAVSKLKPANDILALHEPAAAGVETISTVPQVHFGENYAQELRDKASLLPRTIRWHFIGGLQSGHCKQLARIPNLWCVSSVDTLKKATLLDTARGSFRKEAAAGAASTAPELAGPLNIHVQVNTSGEESKSGCAPGADTLALCRAIVETCPHLRLLGLMTIGAIARSQASAATAENPDFIALREERDRVQTALAPALTQLLELSMGMSEDFESAIASGSSEVRVGSTLFGQRPAKADAQLVA